MRFVLWSLAALVGLAGCDRWPTNSASAPAIHGAPNATDRDGGSSGPKQSDDMSATGVPSGDMLESVIGCYRWFNGGIVEVYPNGTLTHTTPSDSGTWTQTGTNEYTFTWKSGGVDDLILSNGNLSGRNSGGGETTGIATACP